MKFFPLLSLTAALVLLLAPGCGHLDVAPEGDPNRVATGTVNVRMALVPPADAEVVVRVVEPSDITAAPAVASNDLVIGERGTQSRPENVIAEQVIHAPASMPVPYRIEFHATDAAVRRGLNIEARISWGGRLRFRTVESQLVNVAAPQVIWVEPVR
jgi:uncharacterized lipoprotein YbaY